MRAAATGQPPPLFEVVSEAVGTLNRDTGAIDLSILPRRIKVGDKLRVLTSERVAYPLQQAGHDVAPYQGHGFEVGDIVEVLHTDPSPRNAAWILYAGHESGESWWLAEGEFDILA